LAQIRAIEGNRRYWPSAQSLAGFLVQAFEKPIFQHFAPSESAAFQGRSSYRATIALLEPEKGARLK
jgi:hypothetical protein